jgi:hypothetical protein
VLCIGEQPTLEGLHIVNPNIEPQELWA